MGLPEIEEKSEIFSGYDKFAYDTLEPYNKQIRDKLQCDLGTLQQSINRNVQGLGTACESIIATANQLKISIHFAVFYHIDNLTLPESGADRDFAALTLKKGYDYMQKRLNELDDYMKKENPDKQTEMALDYAGTVQTGKEISELQAEVSKLLDSFNQEPHINRFRHTANIYIASEKLKARHEELINAIKNQLVAYKNLLQKHISFLEPRIRSLETEIKRYELAAWGEKLFEQEKQDNSFDPYAILPGERAKFAGIPLLLFGLLPMGSFAFLIISNYIDGTALNDLFFVILEETFFLPLAIMLGVYAVICIVSLVYIKRTNPLSCLDVFKKYGEESEDVVTNTAVFISFFIVLGLCIVRLLDDTPQGVEWVWFVLGNIAAIIVLSLILRLLLQPLGLIIYSGRLRNHRYESIFHIENKMEFNFADQDALLHELLETIGAEEKGSYKKRSTWVHSKTQSWEKRVLNFIEQQKNT